MREHNGVLPVKKMALALKISRSRYYSWLNAPLSAHEERDHEMGGINEKIYRDNRGAYSSPRVHLDMIDEGIHRSRKRVARIMREKGVRGQQKRRFKATTDSGYDLPVAPNLVGREFTVDSPNRVWVSDITFIWTMEGWIYLCIILDIFSQIAAGWATDSRITKDLPIKALAMAVMHRIPDPGLVFHSDRGVQYAADGFRKLIEEYQMVQSISRKGDCWDNACAESFFQRLRLKRYLIVCMKRGLMQYRAYLNTLRYSTTEREDILFLTL
jgi:putative transposase